MIAAQTNDGEFLTVKFKPVANHRAIKQERLIREQIATRRDTALFTKISTSIKVRKEGHRTSHMHRQTAARAGGQADRITAKIKVQRHINRRQIFGKCKGHAKGTLNRIKEDFQTRWQHTRSIHRQHKFLQRCDLLTRLMQHHAEGSSSRSRTLQNNQITIHYAFDRIGAKCALNTVNRLIKRDFTSINQGLGKPANGVQKQRHRFVANLTGLHRNRRHFKQINAWFIEINLVVNVALEPFAKGQNLIQTRIKERQGISKPFAVLHVFQRIKKVREHQDQINQRQIAETTNRIKIKRGPIDTTRQRIARCNQTRRHARRQIKTAKLRVNRQIKEQVILGLHNAQPVGTVANFTRKRKAQRASIAILVPDADR